MLNKSLCLIFATAALISGCSGLQTSSDISRSDNTDMSADKSSSATTLAPADIEPDILYGLLVAELAGQRNRYDILLGNYLSAAKKTGDAGIAKRTTQIAMSLRAHKVATAAAELWYQSAPNDPDAKQALAGQLVLDQKLDQAIALLEELLASDNKANFESLTANSKNLSNVQRNDLIQQLDRLLAIYPNNSQLLLSQSVLLQLNGRTEDALNRANKLYRIEPGPRSLSLKSRLNHQLGHTTKALTDLEKSLKTNPNSRPLRVLYAQILIDDKQLLAAQQQFAILLEQFPQDHQLKLTLALLNLENDSRETGNQLLQELTNIPSMADEAHYYLGQSFEKTSRADEAIHHYKQVASGSKLLPAFQQIGTLLLQQDLLAPLQQVFEVGRQTHQKQRKNLFIIEAELIAEKGHTTTAIELLNIALEEFPKDINLLYTRAMTVEKNNDLAAMENDLRAILSLEPDNAMVLNALGYTLADRTTRYEEALALITRAKELKPNDPAITDSLGWAQFRLGNYEEAIKLLEQALNDFPDHEVAAHLGEALWVTGQQQRANQVWSDALHRTPDSIILKRVIDRLSPSLNQ
ncbi:MAG: tetratricopeptide repeat protein [Pseudomonadales bacterium]